MVLKYPAKKRTSQERFIKFSMAVDMAEDMAKAMAVNMAGGITNFLEPFMNFIITHRIKKYPPPSIIKWLQTKFFFHPLIVLKIIRAIKR